MAEVGLKFIHFKIGRVQMQRETILKLYLSYPLIFAYICLSSTYAADPTYLMLHEMAKKRYNLKIIGTADPIFVLRNVPRITT